MTAFIGECLVKGTFILMIAFLGDVLLRRRLSAAQRHLLWMSGFVVLAVLPLMTFAPLESAPIAYRVPARALESNVLRISVDAGSAAATSIAAILAWIWLTGCAVLALRLIAGSWRMRKIANAGRLWRRAGNVDVLLSPDLHSPLAWRASKPMIILPANADEWPQARLGMVLDHELAHIQRLDLWANWLVQWMTVLYWPNPLVWLARREERTAREAACDDAVTDATPAHDYAAELVALSREAAISRTPIAAVAMARPSGLESRVRHILDRTRKRRRVSSRTILIVAAIAALMTIPVSALRAEGGSVRGKIGDSSGPMASAKLTLTGADGRSMTAVSDTDGNYVFPDVAAGAYKMVVEASGYRTEEFPAVHVRSGQPVMQRIVLRSAATATESGSSIPEAIYRVNPTYPRGAKERKVSGEVKLDVIIGTNGSVVSAMQSSSPDEELTQAAIEAVKQWRFVPDAAGERKAEVIIHFTLAK